ncbi:uncharacterized protein N7482_009406 [Penicillium canariense]|uniref:FAD-binding domain-containing protein n=1 Tax=Penicillium canariense TaxID=189055 RepID=A0A9W9HMJ2_9EURO|nr:uncharacterized protein N7482_009406 [Penicillium canariense]KAJ5152928.1 hypothetical protein N7482_009406 [Penicillium canariense]
MPAPKLSSSARVPLASASPASSKSTPSPAPSTKPKPLDMFATKEGAPSICTFDLHPRAGQAALKAAGLFKEFQKYSRPEGEAMKLIQPDDAPKEFDGEGLDRPEIDRVKLRDILLDSLEEGTVKWGKKVMRVEPDPSARANTPSFSPTSQPRRPSISSSARTSGITSIELWALDVDAKNPWLSEYIGKGSCFMFDEGRALQCQRQGTGACGIDFANPSETTRQEMVDKYWSDCSTDVKRVILSAKDELIPRKLYMLSVGIQWKSKLGVTLLGDAAHLMTPFAGVGVNVSLADAMDLAKAILRRKASVVAKVRSDGYNIGVAVEEYEKIFERGRMNAEKTRKNLGLHFSEKGGAEIAGRLSAHAEAMAKGDGRH